MPATATRSTRSWTSSRSQALGALDMVVAALDRALEALEHQDVELAQIVIADDDRIDGRYLEVHQGILSLLATPGAGRQRPAHGRRAAARDQARRAHGRPVREHRQADPAHRPRAAGDEEMLASSRAHGRAGASEVRQAKQAFELRDVDLAQDLVRQDDEINRLNREVFRMARGDGRRRGPPRVGHDDDASSPARSSASATTPSTSASRSASWSPGCSASSATRRTPCRADHNSSTIRL